MVDMLFKAEFTFSKDIPKFVKNAIINEYLRLRHYGAEAINPKVEQWNSEYTGPWANEDDDLKDYGGTEYCEYIRSKMREELKRVNRLHPSLLIVLDADEIGDIVGKSRIGNVIMTLELIPVKGGG